MGVNDWLVRYGVNDAWQNSEKHNGLVPARVCAQHQTIYTVIFEGGIVSARVSGHFAHEATDNTAFPTVGDVVFIAPTDQDGPAIIHHVLERRSVFVRKAAGTSGTSQIIAANVDTAMICMSLNRDFNLRRLERYVTTVWNSGATPVVVLTKSDLCKDVEARIKLAKSSAPGVDVIAVSATQDVRSALGQYIQEGKTIVFVGSSGVGKSTLINALMGENVMQIQEIGVDDRGRHTTTNRQMLLLPGGGVVIDTPGLRALEIEGDRVAAGFSDIETLASKCRFYNCSHTGEPDCAVQEAIQNGTLSEKRLKNYQKLQREAAYQGLNAKRRERAKVENMFGSMGEMKRAKRELKRNRNR